MGEWNGVQLMVLRRRRGDREIVEVWMDGRIECRVLRRSRGIVEIAEVEVCAEVEVWMGWRMECRVLRRSGVDSEAMELMQRVCSRVSPHTPGTNPRDRGR